MSASAEQVLQDISLAASTAAPIAGAASPAAGLVLALIPVFSSILQQVIADQVNGNATTAQLAAQWGTVTSGMLATHTAVQALVAAEEKAHAASVATAPAA